MKNIDFPQHEDSLIRHIWLSNVLTPVLSVSLELNLFELLALKPLSLDELSTQLGLSSDSAEALTATLGGAGLIQSNNSGFSLTPVSNSYLLRDSPFYWGHMINWFKEAQLSHDSLMEILRQRKPTAMGDGILLTTGWEENSMSNERARTITSAMHSHSFPIALGLAQQLTLPENCHVLDLGGGSACLSIALATKNKSATFTVADLPTVCEVAQDYISQFNMQERIGTHALDMFNQQWPVGYDVIFAANVLHDWDKEQCQFLLQNARQSLKKGGEILIYEMLIDEDQAGPLIAGMFSITMLHITKGKQFRASELETLLKEAGFSEPHTQPIYSGYSLTRARA
ncbi:methyltransferase [Pectobacterium sp. A5351]|uniref:methyltransferase n=1 Tax=Pectobacterium sp. A5351 TaxID=2914983 RepID=UPI0023303F0D|nr:methyltransferase [Pectobacterium sp. A5351]WCG82390.1 methyltransferase [Pectobacterium sp. A5351]